MTGLSRWLNLCKTIFVKPVVDAKVTTLIDLDRPNIDEAMDEFFSLLSAVNHC